MNLNEQLDRLESLLLSGDVTLAELPLALEPLLWSVSGGEADEAIVRKTMNDLELVLFTLPLEDQPSAVIKLLKDARKFVQERIPGRG